MSVRDNAEAHRFELDDGDEVGAFIDYRVDGAVVELVHTETQSGHEGRGLGSRVVRETLDELRRRGAQLRPTCPFVRDYVAKHPSFVELVPTDERARFQLG